MRVLMLVIGLLLLFSATLFLVRALMAYPSQRALLLAWAGWFGAGGGLVILVRGLIFVFPDFWRRKQSPSRRMRAEQYARRHTRPPRVDPPSRQEGSVLILVLILVGLVSALLVQTHTLVRTRSMREHHAQDRTALRQAATDAVLASLQRLADDVDLGVDGTNEAWAVRREYETPLGISIISRVDDGQARFDLNNLHPPSAPLRRTSEEITLDLQTLCGDFNPGPGTVALRDFVDADQNGPREAAYYRQLAPTYRCPNRVLYGWHELCSIDGWSPERLARKPREAGIRGFNASLVDHITLIPAARTQPIPININTAARETLLAVMGIDQEQLVDMALTLRAIRPIRRLDVFAVTAGPELFDRIAPHLDVRSRYFKATARAYRDGRSLVVESWVRRQDDGRVEILQWLEGADS